MWWVGRVWSTGEGECSAGKAKGIEVQTPGDGVGPTLEPCSSGAAKGGCGWKEGTRQSKDGEHSKKSTVMRQKDGVRRCGMYFSYGHGRRRRWRKTLILYGCVVSRKDKIDRIATRSDCARVYWDTCTCERRKSDLQQINLSSEFTVSTAFLKNKDAFVGNSVNSP